MYQNIALADTECTCKSELDMLLNMACGTCRNFKAIFLKMSIM